MPTEVLNARVKQKINTEANWIAEEDTFGVILEGEQAFVKDEAGNLVNFKIGDGTKKFSELPYFIVYYTGVTSQKILTYLDQTDNVTIPSRFRDKSLLMDVIFINNSGDDIDLLVGTTDGGNEILSTSVPIGAVTIGRKYEFTDTETVYFTGLTGKSFSMFVLYFQLDEAPATPPTGSGSFRYPKGHCGIFEPIYEGHENDVWDFATGLGKPDTGYDNCALSGTNGTKDRGGYYSIGYKSGDTIGGQVGASDSQVQLVVGNLPVHSHLMFNADSQNSTGNDLSSNTMYVDVQRNAGINRDYNMAQSSTPATRGKTSDIGSGTKFDIRPNSRVDLYFVAISD